MSAPNRRLPPVAISRVETAPGAPGNFHALSSQINSAPQPIVNVPGFVAPQIIGVDFQTVTATVPAITGGATGLITLRANFSGLPPKFRIQDGQTAFLDVAVYVLPQGASSTAYVVGMPTVQASFGTISSAKITGSQSLASPYAIVTCPFFSAATLPQGSLTFGVRGTLYGQFTG
jgi:hypothetical protein